MEIIRLPGYTDEDKLAIANRFLIPRQREQAGLTAEQLPIDEAVVRELIAHYTREAGVRQLEQRIGSLARKLALASPKGCRAQRSKQRIFRGFSAQRRMRANAGAARCLYVEATLLPESRGLILTGHLGEVMKESAQAALSYLWAHASILGLDPKKLEHSGIHVHVPAGATPKDGPSAGVTMAAAIASLVSGTPLRSDTAMTGEVTLTGLVLKSAEFVKRCWRRSGSAFVA